MKYDTTFAADALNHEEHSGIQLKCHVFLSYERTSNQTVEKLHTKTVVLGLDCTLSCPCRQSDACVISRFFIDSTTMAE